MSSKQKTLVTGGHSPCALGLTSPHSTTAQETTSRLSFKTVELCYCPAPAAAFIVSALMMFHIVCYHLTLYSVLDFNCLQGHLSAAVHSKDTQAPRTARFWQHSCSRQQKMMLPTRIELWCWWSLIEVTCPAQTPTGRI